MTMPKTQSEVTGSVLHSWQEIANFIGRGPRTVQRWEHRFGMPIHRKDMHRASLVFAFANELESWLRSMPSKRVCVQQPQHLRVPSGQKQIGGFLNSWKEVAQFIGIGVRTVQRWERYAGLPVHRPARKLRSPIVAIPAEVERWLNNERSTPILVPSSESQSPVRDSST